MAFFPSLKQNFIVHRSSYVSSCTDWIFEIHQMWQSGFSRVCSNCCCSCSFEPEIIKIGQSSHKTYSNNILIFQESTTIFYACTKKSLETYRIHFLRFYFPKFKFSQFQFALVFSFFCFLVFVSFLLSLFMALLFVVSRFAVSYQQSMMILTLQFLKKSEFFLSKSLPYIHCIENLKFRHIIMDCWYETAKRETKKAKPWKWK